MVREKNHDVHVRRPPPPPQKMFLFSDPRTLGRGRGWANMSQPQPPKANLIQSGPPGANLNQSGPPGANLNQSGPPEANLSQSEPPGANLSPNGPELMTNSKHARSEFVRYSKNTSRRTSSARRAGESAPKCNLPTPATSRSTNAIVCVNLM